MDPLTRDLLGASPSLRRLVLALVRDEHLADDLVQEIWVAALRRRDRPPQDPGRWAFAFVRRLLRGAWRREERRREQEALAAESTTSRGPDEMLEHQSFLQLIAKTAEGLDEPYRTVIRLRYWEELSPPEIAARLERAHDTVKTQLRRGLEILRERLDREHGGDRRTWMAPLLLLLDVDEVAAGGLPPASAGLQIGALAAAAAVPAVLALGWLLLRDADPPEAAAEATAASAPAPTPSGGPDPLAPARGRALAPADAPAPDPAEPAATPVPLGPRLAVQVVDERGRPVPGAEVHVARAGGFRLRGSTDAAGVLELAVDDEELLASDLPELAGRASLYAYKPGHASSAQVWVRCGPEAPASLRLVLPASELVIRGLVVDARDRPIPRARVVVDSTNLTRRRDGDLVHSQRFREATGDDSGWFKLEGLEPGVHMLSVDAPGWVPAAETADGRAGGSIELTVVLGEAGVVTGVVRDVDGRAVPGAVLSYDFDQGLPTSAAREARAGPDGEFQIENLPPGRHALFAQDPERSGLACREEVDVASGRPTVWNPVLEEAHGIHVRVVDAEDVPAEGWTVNFVARGDAFMREAVTGPDGRAAIYDVPPALAMEAHARLDVLADRFPRAALTGLRPGPEEHDLVVSRAEPTGSVRGTLLDDRDRPSEGAKMVLFSTAIWHAEFEPVDPASGEFAFERIADGAYDLRVLWKGHGNLGLGPVEVADGAPADRGVIRLPALGSVRIDWSWPSDADHADLHYHLYQGKYEGLASKVFDGSAPPPERFDLLPGPYFLVVERDVAIQWRRFEVESGAEVLVASGPGLGDE